MRVLLIDDNDELCAFLSLCLSEASIDVVSAKTPSAALQRTEAEKFDAYIVDSILGQDDGLALVGEIRATKNGRTAPVLLMSQISTALARRMALAAGCNDFLVKPFGPTQFVEQVRALEKIKR